MRKVTEGQVIDDNHFGWDGKCYLLFSQNITETMVWRTIRPVFMNQWSCLSIKGQCLDLVLGLESTEKFDFQALDFTDSLTFGFFSFSLHEF